MLLLLLLLHLLLHLLLLLLHFLHALLESVTLLVGEYAVDASLHQGRERSHFTVEFTQTLGVFADGGLIEIRTDLFLETLLNLHGFSLQLLHFRLGFFHNLPDFIFLVFAQAYHFRNLRHLILLATRGSLLSHSRAGEADRDQGQNKVTNRIHAVLHKTKSLCCVSVSPTLNKSLKEIIPILAHNTTHLLVNITTGRSMSGLGENVKNSLFTAIMALCHSSGVLTMAINWFPGHMHKARKEIKQVMPQMDLIIEVVDARIPFSSENPMVPALRGDTPVIKILNKRDLADPAVTEQWLAWLEKEKGTRAITLTHNQRNEALDILRLAQTMVADNIRDTRALRIMILGIPNVGKSTIINTLAGRPVAKTGNEPAVTRAQQAIKLPDNILLYDTPGFLWPKLAPEACGYRLAVTGAIRAAVIEYEDVALFAADHLLATYPEQVLERYGLTETPADGLALMDAIAGRRRFFSRGGVPDLHKVAEVLLNELRAGTLGPVSLETPAMVEREQADEAVRLEEAAAAKAGKQTGRKGKPRR